MKELIFNYSAKVDIIEKIATFHINFEHIHPFEDGNGRTGRILINHQLLSNNEVPIVISDDRKIEYFEYLENYDIKGLTNMIKELQKFEINKIKEYCPDIDIGF